MWMSYLIDGLEDGRLAFYIKVHHSVIAGVARVAMIGRLTSRRARTPIVSDSATSQTAT
ncbi:wax ester/triacylglycerol synthase family O-acyltransferase [Mycobacterium palustre]|uniref:wax ester/triacylglycerol synthase family O-acyltransferase n=1 Tax=Mycobacterium palustre TaxID=153971 RepID=UPI0021F371C9|nr:wax ester/triacylglycerol synthase family O-acyltransferase [Mycobacterium palustre]